MPSGMADMGSVEQAADDVAAADTGNDEDDDVSDADADADDETAEARLVFDRLWCRAAST